jgi:hypothetical protein
MWTDDESQVNRCETEVKSKRILASPITLPALLAQAPLSALGSTPPQDLLERPQHQEYHIRLKPASDLTSHNWPDPIVDVPHGRMGGGVPGRPTGFKRPEVLQLLVRPP